MTRALLLALVLAPTLTPTAAALPDRDVSRYNLTDDKLAIQGYDPVAYFDVGGAQAQRGKADLTVEHEGVRYRFATAANQATFVADPERFEPTYGGWCAFAMSKDKRIGVDPLAFRVSRGRLFLFVDTDYLEVDEDWVEDEVKNIKAADQFWRGFSGEEPRAAAATTWRPYGEFNLSGASLGLAGFDPVSYHPEGGGKPKKGVKAYSLRHGGVLYRFADEANRKRFAAAPERYEPAHGGWCSFAMGATGEKVEVDPKAFRLVDGQLHLFYNAWLTDTRDDWDENPVALKAQADTRWSKLLTAAVRD